MNYSIEINGSVLSIILLDNLNVNRQYTLKILPGLKGINGTTEYILENTLEFWFTSTYCPLFTSLTQVKLAAGPIADYFTDDTIYRMIHKNSLDAVDLYNLNNNLLIPYDFWGCTWNDVPYTLRKYVECKTAYDILSLHQSVIQNGGGDGSQTKTLGDMTISYKSGASSDINNSDPSRKQQLYECWTELLRSIKTVRTAVRGINDYSKGYTHPIISVNSNRTINHGDFRTPGTPFIRRI